jgi:hypothetical protein
VTGGVDDREQRHQVARRLRFQALGPSTWNTVLLTRLATEVEEGDDVWPALHAIAHLGRRHAPALRLLAAAHRLALEGTAPDFAAHAPTCGGDGDAEAAWPVLRDLCCSGALEPLLHQPVQTNEPRRAAALLPAIGAVQAITGLPVRLLEIGSSAGLLLRLDRYRYEVGAATWGEQSSPVLLRAEGDAPLRPVEVVSRRGCDPSPLDPTADRARILSYVWADDVARFRTIEAALDVAAAHPVAVDAAPASAWLPERLADAGPGAATVVFHSIVWQYLTPAETAAVEAAITGAGSRASAAAPLAWLRFEPHATAPESGVDLRLRLWPGGDDVSLGRCGYHGSPISWHEPAPSHDEAGTRQR